MQVGDRPLTDIVYGNRNGFLTILTEPLSLAEEPFIVKQVCFSYSFSFLVLEEFNMVFFNSRRNFT
jgi:predicted HAD superfamily phosphohydrolase YqeG